MTQLSTEEPVLPGAQDDHTQVLALLSSAEMQKRLQNARVQRAKILKARDSLHNDLSEVKESGGGSVIKSSVDGLSSTKNGQTSSEVRAQNQPVNLTTPRNSWAKIFVTGLIPGLALGSGLMWYSIGGFSGPPAIFHVPRTVAGQNELAVAGKNENVSQTAQNNADVDTSPWVQPFQADPMLADSPPGRPADNNGPALNNFGAYPIAPDLDRVALDKGSAQVTLEADQPLVQLPPVVSVEKQITPSADETAPIGHKTPIPALDAGQVSDRPPSKSIDPSVPLKSQGRLDTLASSTSAATALPLQVTLHVSPDLSQENSRNAKAMVTTEEVEVASISIAKFSIVQSEVRFFHQADAVAATRIAQDMRIKARDFSTYKPTPDKGTLEIWLADEG